MSNPILVHSQANIDFVGDYKYPTTAKVFEIGNEDEKIHWIFVSVTSAALLTATDGTGYGYAPYGSMVFQNLSGTVRIFMRNSLGTWVSGTLS